MSKHFADSKSSTARAQASHLPLPRRLLGDHKATTTSASRRVLQPQAGGSSKQTLRRRRGGEPGRKTTPVRELSILRGRDDQANGAAQRSPASPQKSPKFATGPFHVGQDHVHPAYREAERDVEKGIAYLDGQSPKDRDSFGTRRSPDRLTFAEWHAIGSPNSGSLESSPKYVLSSAQNSSRSSVGGSEPTNHQTTQHAAGNDRTATGQLRRSRQSSRQGDESAPPDRPPAPLSEHRGQYPSIPDPEDPMRRLSNLSLRIHRMIAVLIVILCNITPLIVYFENRRHLWVLIFIVSVKAKDVLSTLISLAVLGCRAVTCRLEQEVEVPPKTILSLVACSFETEAQIMKTVDSVRSANLGPHRQVLCMILDGQPKTFIQKRLVRSHKPIRRPYVTWLHNRNEITVECGFLDGTPIIFMQKTWNEGKKDSLILCHDLFNHMRSEAPLYTKLLREEIWNQLMPSMFGEPSPVQFDAIFCTDADSTIHPTAQRRLVEELHRHPKSIAACGVLFAELDYRTEWTIWSLFQQFQYSYGQVVRRQAEGIWGRVTCLPGCITMIKVRPEMAGAISKYSKPVTDVMFWRHQVQFLGTDRRLTYSMLSQGTNLRTLFVPDAVSETVCPQSLKHYLNQRRRWGSNAYFNNYFYLVGEQQYLVSRLWAFIDISRMTFVYYRQINNILFIYGLARHFEIIKIVPLLVVTQTPTLWFFISVLARYPILRSRLHKLLLGLLLNFILSPVLSIIVFSRMILQLGGAGIIWNSKGVVTAKPDPTVRAIAPRSSLSSHRLASIVRSTLLGECFSSSSPSLDYGNGTHQDKDIPDVPPVPSTAPGSYAPSVADTVHSARSHNTAASARSSLPSRLRSSFSSRRRSVSTTRDEEKAWPLDDQPVPPLPAQGIVIPSREEGVEPTSSTRRRRRQPTEEGAEIDGEGDEIS